MLTKHTQDLVNAFGFLHQSEAEILQMYAELISENSICINIGAGAGTSALAVLEKRPDLTNTFYTIDITSGSSPLGSLEGERNAFDKAGMDYPNQILGDSKNIGKNWDRGKINFLIIDGDHSAKGIRGDIKCWESHLNKNAIVFVHDYNSLNWPEVATAVDELMLNNDDYEFITIEDTYIVFKYIKKE